MCFDENSYKLHEIKHMDEDLMSSFNEGLLKKLLLDILRQRLGQWRIVYEKKKPDELKAELSDICNASIDQVLVDWQKEAK